MCGTGAAAAAVTVIRVRVVVASTIMQPYNPFKSGAGGNSRPIGAITVIGVGIDGTRFVFVKIPLSMFTRVWEVGLVVVYTYIRLGVFGVLSWVRLPVIAVLGEGCFAVVERGGAGRPSVFFG